MVHGIFIADWDGDKHDDVLTASFTGPPRVSVRARTSAGVRTEIAKGDPAPWPKSGASDVAVGRLGRARFLAAIEPWHGNQVAIYRQRNGAWQRQVIDDSLADGHTISTGDFDGDGREDVIAGFRGQGRSVFIYRAEDAAGARWSKQVLDNGAMGAAACAVVDLNGDKRPDIACIDSTSLKWYEISTLSNGGMEAERSPQAYAVRRRECGVCIDRNRDHDGRLAAAGDAKPVAARRRPRGMAVSGGIRRVGQRDAVDWLDGARPGLFSSIADRDAAHRRGRRGPVDLELARRPDGDRLLRPGIRNRGSGGESGCRGNVGRGECAASDIPESELVGGRDGCSPLVMLLGENFLVTFAAAAVAMAAILALIAPPSRAPESRSSSRPQWIAAAMLFLYVGAEAAVYGWMPSRAARGFGGNTIWAATASVFWEAILAGRAITGAALRRFPLQPVLIWSTVLALVGSVVMVADGRPESLLPAGLVVGLGMAPVFPLVVSQYAGGRAPGVVFAMGGLGGALVPLLVGYVSSETHSLRLGMSLIPVALGVLLWLEVRKRIE